jgi:hypothetical protein
VASIHVYIFIMFSIGLEVNTEKTKYMLLSRYHNAGQNHDMKIGNRRLKMWHGSDIWGQ